MNTGLKISGTAGRTLMAATTGFFFGSMSISLFGPTSKAITEAMSLSPVQVGLLVAIPSLSGSLLRIPMGASVDVNGGCKSFSTLLFLSIIGLLGLSMLFTFQYPSGMNGMYIPILVLGCLAGCSIATFSVGVSQVSYWYKKKDQGYALGVFGGLGTTSAGLVAFFLPVILSAIGFISAYYVITAIMLFGVIFYLFTADNAPFFQYLRHGLDNDEARQKAEEHGQELFPTGSVKKSLSISAKIPQTWILVICYFTTFGGFIAITSWFPTFWQTGHGLTLFVAGSLTAIFSVLAALMRVPGGKLADKIGGEKVAIYSLTLVGVCGILLSLNMSVVLLFISTILMAIAFGLNNAAIMKLVPTYVPQSVGGASGWVGGLGAFGGFVFPPLLGLMSGSHYGYGLGFIIFTVLAIVDILLLKYGRASAKE